MQFEKLFQLLAREDVKEIALQADRPPCVLIGDGYTPVVNRAFGEDELIACLVEANGQVEVMGLVDGARRWQFDHAGLGSIRVSAGYHGGVLQARLRLVERKTDSEVSSFENLVTRNGEEPQTGARQSLQTGSMPAARSTQPTVSARPVQHTTGGPAVRTSQPTSGGPAVRSSQPTGGPRDPQPTTGGPAVRAPQPTGGGPAVRAPQPTVGMREPQPTSGGPAGRASQPTPSIPVARTPQQAGRAAIAPAFTVPPESAERKPAPAGRSFEGAKEIALGRSPHDTFESLLRLSRERSASDIHVLADRPPMLRIGGDLVKVGPVLPAELVEQMLMQVVPERLRQGLACDGSVDFALQHESLGRFRTNVSRQRTGMKLTARPVSANAPSLADLGLPDAIAGATRHHQGLIIVTGPTGHGKTSTLAAIVDVINANRTDHIITVEDPIEYVHQRKQAVVSQREVGTHTRTFAAALKGSLREDPDVIAVGELRDTETVRMALSASETGHLVISTMNTPSAAKAIERLIDLFPPGDQPQVRMSLSGGLRMIISQRLVPSADRKTVKAAVELLPGSPPLWALIRDNKTFQIPSLQQRGKSLGIVRLDDSLADLVRSGHTTIEIAREFAESPEQLEAVVRGAPVRAPEAAPANDPGAPAAAAQKFGKDMLSKAGKLFGGDK